MLEFRLCYDSVFDWTEGGVPSNQNIYKLLNMSQVGIQFNNANELFLFIFFLNKDLDLQYLVIVKSLFKRKLIRICKEPSTELSLIDGYFGSLILSRPWNDCDPQDNIMLYDRALSLEPLVKTACLSTDSALSKRNGYSMPGQLNPEITACCISCNIWCQCDKEKRGKTTASRWLSQTDIGH